MTARRRTAMAALGILGVASLLGACGGGSSDSSKSSSTTAAALTSKSSGPTEKDLADTAEAYAQAVIDGDLSAAYDLISADCQDLKTRAEYTAEAAQALSRAEDMGVDMSTAVITEVRVRNVTSTTGEVTIQAEVDGRPIDEEDSWETWTVEDGEWRTTNCGGGTTANGSSSGSSGSSSGSTSDPELDNALTSEPGDVIDLGNGMIVTVYSVDYVYLSSGTAVSVDLRAENNGTTTLAPDVTVRCADSLETGTAVPEGSTFEPYGSMPAGTYMDGAVSILPPIGLCDMPAWVLITSADDSNYAMKVQIPSDVVEAING